MSNNALFSSGVVTQYGAPYFPWLAEGEQHGRVAHTHTHTHSPVGPNPESSLNPASHWSSTDPLRAQKGLFVSQWQPFQDRGSKFKAVEVQKCRRSCSWRCRRGNVAVNPPAVVKFLEKGWDRYCDLIRRNGLVPRQLITWIIYIRSQPMGTRLN